MSSVIGNQCSQHNSKGSTPAEFISFLTEQTLLLFLFIVSINNIHGALTN